MSEARSEDDGVRESARNDRSIGTAAPSPGDDFVDDIENERRNRQHVDVLLDAGVDVADAEMAMEVVGQTAYGGPRPPASDEVEAFLEE